MLVNTVSIQEAKDLAERKQLKHSLHFFCPHLPPEYGYLAVPHRVVIGTDGVVRHNLDGLQGSGKLPKAMPGILASLRAAGDTRALRPRIAAVTHEASAPPPPRHPVHGDDTGLLPED